jgi:hypothetical protein
VTAELAPLPVSKKSPLAGLGPAIHVLKLPTRGREDAGARHKAGHGGLLKRIANWEVVHATRASSEILERSEYLVVGLSDRFRHFEDFAPPLRVWMIVTKGRHRFVAAELHV